MKTLCIATCLAMALLQGCASYSGSSLIAGKSTAAEVEALMGNPAQRIETPGGGSVLYYPRGPFGRVTYAVVLGADGTVQAVEQRLTDENIAKLVLGTTTTKEARELFGPPSMVRRFPRLQRDIWEYPMGEMSMPYILYVQSSYDGIVREAFKLKDYSAEPPSGRGKRH